MTSTQPPATIAYVGNTVPVELIRAAGCAPRWERVSAYPEHGALGRMEAEHEPEVRALFAQIVSGSCADCLLLVIPGTSDGYRFLFQYLKEEKRQGNHLIPPLYMFDLLFGDRPSMVRHRRSRFADFLDRIETVSGRTVTAEAISREISATNQSIARLGALDGMRRAGQVPGPLAHDTLMRFRADCMLPDLPAASDPRRPHVLLVPAHPLYFPDLHEAIEGLGGRVVAEDDWCGSRAAGAPIAEAGDRLDALAAWYRDNALSPRMSLEQRSAWTRREIADGGHDVVVFYVPPSDQHFGWEIPDFLSAARDNGLPALLLRDDFWTDQGRAVIEGQLAVLFQSEEGKRA